MFLILFYASEACNFFQKKFLLYESKIKKLFYHQQFFCQNQNIFNNKYLEEKLKFIKIKFDNDYFGMFVYKKKDVVSNSILKKGIWEDKETKSILIALSYYSIKLNLPKKDIYVLDIGSNIGWYSLILGKKGYQVISFEASNFNYYILKTIKIKLKIEYVCVIH